MKLELTISDCFCGCEIFRVNDIEADVDDFGAKYDYSPEEADEYECGNMVFQSFPSSDRVLKKYSITQDEYNEITDALIVGLSFGRCGLCK
jgi:hypothetical protein